MSKQPQQNPAILDWAMRYPFIASIQRAYEPGSRIDDIPVYIAPPNSNIDTFLAGIFPEDKPDWLVKILYKTGAITQERRRIKGAVLVVIDEMDTMTSKELKKLATFVTETHDKGKPRRCAFVGRSYADKRFPAPFVSVYVT